MPFSVTVNECFRDGVSGVVGWYSGGGYTQVLGSSEAETQDILTYLRDTDWLTLR